MAYRKYNFILNWYIVVKSNKAAKIEVASIIKGVLSKSKASIYISNLQPWRVNEVARMNMNSSTFWNVPEPRATVQPISVGVLDSSEMKQYE
jgi:hypothetical protein